ncbi:MAG: hypothetical protein NC344_05105 [Bacteroidales bacterium]|nr:hypothetical protein [Bacteroidales bacterium]MCM1147205.1 hypothetical protein [Bacteroidales bacterium]MCM1205431.1 hypothetical protein [Bacillota bacterium]MCM1509764.1 hypothetical protein [Clostridium sp.]
MGKSTRGISSTNLLQETAEGKSEASGMAINRTYPVLANDMKFNLKYVIVVF